jgi:hypothetical protein
MNVKQLLTIAGLAAGLAGAAACGGAAGAGSSTASTAADARSVPGAAPAAGSAQSAPKATGGAGSVAAAPPEGTKVQRSARMSLTVPNGEFDSRLDRVIALVEGSGGYISGSQAQADQGQPLRSGQVTFQVPSNKFEGVVAGLRQLGTAQDISISGNDVSQQYVDLQARLRNAQAQRDAMLALLQQARSVGDIIQVQTQLGQITGQIEQIEGQIQYLDHSTSYSTVAVTITEGAAAAARDEWGLRTAASQAVHNMVTSLDVLVLVLGTLAPLLVIGGAGAYVGRRLWLRGRRPDAPASAGPWASNPPR